MDNILEQINIARDKNAYKGDGIPREKLIYTHESGKGRNNDYVVPPSEYLFPIKSSLYKKYVSLHALLQHLKETNCYKYSCRKRMLYRIKNIVFLLYRL